MKVSVSMVAFPKRTGWRVSAAGGCAWVVRLLLATVWCGAGRPAGAACNLIPSAQTTFRAVLGSTDRPFAGPGDVVELRVRPEVCDAASVGVSASIADEVVTVLFTPPGAGPVNAVVLAVDCTDIPLSCPGAASVRCQDADDPTLPFGLAVVERDGERRLLVRLPDTDADLAPSADGRGFAGPVRIVVKDRRVAPPGQLAACEFVSQQCSAGVGAVAGVAACVDEFFRLDGTCRTTAAVVDPTFASFTALPRPNDFQRLCTSPSPPCLHNVDEVRFATDAAGNLYVPVDWQGILLQREVPVPRLLRASTAQHAITIGSGPIVIPGKSFLGSFTPEGAKLPPIFEPQFDHGAVNELTVFGSADAAHTILRVSRRSGEFHECNNAVNRPCNSDEECPGAIAGSCQPATCCSGPATCGVTPCGGDADCGPGEECGPSLFEFRSSYYAGTGPVVIPRFATAAGVCELDPAQLCGIPAPACASGTCVDLRIEAQDPVPLEGLGGTDSLFTFAQREADAGPCPPFTSGCDLNGDGDRADTVVVLRDRKTGAVLPIGGSGADARAATEIRHGRFRFPAIAGEGDLVAFLESEPVEGVFADQDKNGDGDSADTIVRVFRGAGGSADNLLPATNIAADGDPVIDDHSLVLSDPFVFFRAAERDGSAAHVELVSKDTLGNPLIGGINVSGGLSISGDGRFVAFGFDGNGLLPGDGNNTFDVFLRDRDTDADGIFDEPGAVSTTLVSYNAANTTTASGPSSYPALSSTGRFVSFTSFAGDLVAGPAPGWAQVYVRDRDTNATVRVSVDADDNPGTNGNSGGQRVSVSADGRYVAFDSGATNLVPGDTNGVTDVFVRDRDSDGNSVFDEPGGTRTIRLSVAADGKQGNDFSGGPSMTPDGRFVVFQGDASNLVSGDTNRTTDIFLVDRDADGNGVLDEGAPGATSIERASVSSSGAEGGRNQPSEFGVVSDDGRYVGFSSQAALAPDAGQEFGGVQDAFLRDRWTGTTQTISLTSADGESGGNLGIASLSGDGRLAVLGGIASVVSNPGAPGGGGPSVIVRDLVSSATTLASLDLSTGAAGNGPTTGDGVISGDGRFVAFASDADNLVAGDTNGRVDFFVYGPQTTSNDITGDGRADDTVLYAVDTSVGPPAAVVPLCPADVASAAAGRVAFVRPESAGTTPSLALCPSGPLVAGKPDLNGDGDAMDGVVHLWRGSGSVDNLHCAATAVTLSPNYLAALVPEAAQGNTALNGDGLADDTVLKVYDLAAATPTSCAQWTSIGVSGLAADSVRISGHWIAFTVPEREQGLSLNGDTDLDDRVLHRFNAQTHATVNLQQAAEEFVLGTSLLAYRTREAAQGQDLNLDGDQDDDVIQIYDLDTQAPAAAFQPQAVRPCELEACDPRLPYRVFANSVKFLTFECDQRGTQKSGCPAGGTDLNNDGDAGDLVIQTYNRASGQTTIVGTVATVTDDTPHNSAPDPTLGDPVDSGGGTTEVFVSRGRCIEDMKVACDPIAPSCADGTFCRRTGNNPHAGTCRRNQGVCVTVADCLPGAVCEYEPIVPASADADADGVADVLDNCPTAANTNQEDLDHDGVGDVCDLQRCGNGIVELDEPCDGAVNATCPGACLPDCSCECTNPLPDPKAKIKVTTRKGKGQLDVKVSLPAAGYDGTQTIGIRLSNASRVIAYQNVGVLSKKGSGWEYKFKGEGIRKVKAKVAGGRLRLKISTRLWFTGDGIDANPANTKLTLYVGPTCYVHAVTKVVQ